MPIVLNGTTGVISGVPVGGLPDGIVDTDMLAANAVTAAKTSGLASVNGITEADQWRVTSDFGMNSQYAATITANWERNDTTFEKIGTGMSVNSSNGHWTFPSTGKWLIQVHWTGERSSGQSYWGIHYCYGMTDGVQSNGFEIMQSYVGIAGNNGRNTAFMQAMFDVQNTSGYKLLFGYYDNINQTTTYKGSSTTNKNSYTFLKLGET
tara:strand:+ start:159 stop:782 length:624 start_codon:yes stop_codon:yes gene_type:complete